MGELTEALRRGERRVTGPRLAILQVLREHRRPLSNKEVLALLPQGYCDLATVYRSMHLLRRLGLVQRFDVGDGVARHELRDAGHDGHHHHLVCRRCAQVVAIDCCLLEEVERELSRHSGYQALQHRLEFTGICPDCQQR
ncbi:MAG: transcriptional repressor [Verrucomicrobiae bacterium]|nr:transcriptional repressor [Verrucomicrobiae bacterium]